jgi:hypothetical protein
VLKGFSKNTFVLIQFLFFKFLIKNLTLSLSLSLSLPALAYLSGQAHLSVPAYLVEPDQVARSA